MASALYSNTLASRLPPPPAVPQDVADRIRASVFAVPDLSGLSEAQRDAVLDTYTLASRSVFYFWVGCISCCWLLMFFIKDKGLQRKEEQETKSEGGRGGPGGQGRIPDEEEAGGETPTSGEEEGEGGYKYDEPERRGADAHVVDEKRTVVGETAKQS